MPFCAMVSARTKNVGMTVRRSYRHAQSGNGHSIGLDDGLQRLTWAGGTGGAGAGWRKLTRAAERRIGEENDHPSSQLIALQRAAHRVP